MRWATMSPKILSLEDNLLTEKAVRCSKRAAFMMLFSLLTPPGQQQRGIDDDEDRTGVVHQCSDNRSE